MVGLERGTVALKPYDKAWNQAFEAEAERLRSAVGKRIVALEHVGSTAIEGLAAKPIIDMLLVVEALTNEQRHWCIYRLENLDYAYRPDDSVSDRLFSPRDWNAIGRTTSR